MSRARLVESVDALEAACAACLDVDELCVDTEFVRERTYFARLCLIQVRAGDETWLIDPLAIGEPDALWNAFDRVPLVFHAARQDLEIMRQAAGRLPGTLLDTQIMAALAGHAPQIGYAGLAQKLLGIELDKSKTRTDWSRRPLDADELAYAAADVEHLGELKLRLAEALDRTGRLDWARDDSRDLLDSALYAIAADTAWQRVKGIGRLPPAARAVAMAMATWREQTAVERNLPRQWVLRDTDLLAVAERFRFDGSPPRGFDDKATERRHAVAIGRYLTEHRDRLPTPAPSRERPDPAERERVKRLGSVVAAIAAELGIEAEVLASMRELRAATAGERDLRLFRGWRREVVGDAVMEQLAAA